jgi:hypothetical protein
MRAAILWLCSPLLCLQASSLAIGQEWPSPFRHLPENTMAVAHFRVEPLLKSAWGKAALQDIVSNPELKEAFESLKSAVGIDLLDVESATIVLLDPLAPADSAPRLPLQRNQPWNVPKVVAPPAPTAGPTAFDGYTPCVALATQGVGNDGLPLVVIVNARKAIDRKQLLRKKLEVDGGSLTVGVLFLSDRSFVMGRDDALVHFSADTSDKESELGRQLANMDGRPIIQGGYRVAPALKKRLMAEAGGPGPLGMVFPLVNATHTTFTIDFGKSAEVKIRVTTANERQANLAAESAKTLLALVEATAEKSVPELERSVADADEKARSEIREEIGLSKALCQMSKAARVERRDTEVNVSFNIEIQPRQIVRWLQGFSQPQRSFPTAAQVSLTTHP